MPPFPCLPSVPNMKTVTSKSDGALGKVLIVDDNLDLLEIVEQLFQALGYDTITAQNADQALECLSQSNDITILFSDVVMPGALDGVALAQTARQRWPHLKIVLASGYAKQQSDIPSEFVFLPKPYRLADIERLLQRLN